MKTKAINPVEKAIRSWYHNLSEEIVASYNLHLDRLLANAPKRWIVYFPMVLLPCGSFNSDWSFILQSQANTVLVSEYASDLWKLILENVGSKEGKGFLTHLAINSPIPRYETASVGNELKENVLRTPSGIVPLYGNFGPKLGPTHLPRQQDLEEAFWVSTKQNGITQIWAPLYSMFSRGNIGEKQRLIKFHSQDFHTNIILDTATAVDLYAGIGYFVFSYVKMGIAQVIGWELNPWSVEGLRRGALANGWSIRVIRTEDNLENFDEKIVVFQEDNIQAGEKLKKMKCLGNVIHVNCGLLPSSSDSWETAITCLGCEGWLHLHQNVAEKDIEVQRSVIEDKLQLCLDKPGNCAKVKHIELVKTIAPQVWHCVYDVYITKNHISIR